MPGTVNLLWRSQRITFLTVATGKPGGRSYASARSASWVGSSIPGRGPGGVGSMEMGFPLLFYPVSVPLSISISNRLG